MTKFSEEYKKLNPAQKQAVDTIDGPVLVIAGPGTGKTQLLSMRVANILRRTDTNPNNILCLTYTESGKQAMLNRLSELLGGDAKKIEVHTFHGFGTRLISQFHDYFPELINFRPSEDLTLYETLYNCLERLPRSNPLSKQAYGQFIYQNDVRERISQLKRAGILPAAALKKAETDLEWSKSAGHKLTAAFNEAGRLSPKIAGKLVANLEPLFRNLPTSQLGQFCLEELRSAVSDANESGKTSSLSSFKKKWFTPEEGNLHFKPIDQLKKLLALAVLYESYETELKARGLYDYDDMILFALDKLKNTPEFLSLVQETFQYILVDEYQDTNAAQANIINLIADSPIHEGRPNVMVVGDDDQAIYGFQGALGDVLMDFRERWRDVQVITLKENYRSTPSIIDTAQSVISRGQNRLENKYEDVDKSLKSAVSYPNVSPTQFEASSPEAVVEKALSVAKSSSNNHQIAIIATKHKYLQELANRLDAGKVNYYYEGREDLLKDPKMLNLLLLAEAALAIKQKDFKHTSYVLPEIIANQLLPLPRRRAWQVALIAKAQNISWWESLLTLKQSDAKKAIKTLQHLEKTIDPNDGLTSLKEIASSSHLRIIQKIRRLLEHASSYYGRSEIGLSEVLRYGELCKQAGVTLEQTIVKGNNRANVVLLSAHKSKGLEFDRVFVLHADHYTWFKEGGRRNNLVLPDGWDYLKPLSTTTDDRLRLLYVVMTRAKRELALIKSDSRKEALPGLEDIKVEQHISEELEDYILPEDLGWQTWYLPKTAEDKKVLKHLLQPMLNTYRLSPTHLTTFLDVPHGGPATFFTNILLAIQEPVHPEAIFGSHVHRSLRFAQDTLNKTGKLPSRTELKAFVKKEAPSLDDNHAFDIVEVVYNFIVHSHVLEPGGVSETSLEAMFGDKKITGIIDHYISKDGNMIITDFKTGRAINSWRVREDYYKQKLHRFRQQLMFYELLFSLNPKFRKTKSITSKVVFVEPSRRDVYYQLILDAGKSERFRLDALIHTVWQKVKNLDLPDVSAYGLNMKGIEDFETDLIEGKI